MAGEFAQGSQRGRDPILHGGPGQRIPHAYSFASVTDHDQDGGQSEADLYTINTRLSVTVFKFNASCISARQYSCIIYSSAIVRTVCMHCSVLQCGRSYDSLEGAGGALHGEGGRGRAGPDSRTNVAWRTTTDSTR